MFESSPLIVTRDQIQDYCRSLNQLDWFHFDEARGTSEGFGGIIAPGSLTFALVHSTFFQCVELVDLKALFIGSDRFRVHRPINAGRGNYAHYGHYNRGGSTRRIPSSI